MEGIGLLRALIEATGLPADAVEREMQRLIESKGLSPDQITLEDIRELLAHYLQDVLVEAKAAY